MIRNFCLDILNSGPAHRVGINRRGMVAHVDSSSYETDPGTNTLKVHLDAHFMWPLFPENPKSIPKLFGKT